ncbi:MAG: SPOR domain-containing protein [bacterium]|nr:SPOR domain-containing protein [bacterium]
MYKNIGIAFFTICISTGLTMASTTIDTILITDMPAEVETVAVTKTNVETVTVVKDVTPPVTEVAQPVVTEVTPSVVKEEPVKTEKVSKSGAIRIQFGAFYVKENAEKLYNLLKTQYGDIFYMDNINSYWKVGAQNYTTLKSAKAARKTFISQGFTTIFITH